MTSSPLDVTWDDGTNVMALDQTSKSVYGSAPVLVLPQYEEASDTWGAVWVATGSYTVRLRATKDATAHLGLLLVVASVATVVVLGRRRRRLRSATALGVPPAVRPSGSAPAAGQQVAWPASAAVPRVLLWPVPTCPRCGQPGSPGATLCARCGWALWPPAPGSTWHCPTCGSGVGPQASSCPRCGVHYG